MTSAALLYAARGLFVFPVRRNKTPLTANGHLDATCDRDQIIDWYRRWPWAGIGVACRPSGLLVVDDDPRHAGDENLRDLERQHEPLPETWISRTGGGGGHRFFRRPGVEAADRSVAAGVDIKTNGYVILPPSQHPSGRRYEWLVGFAPDDLALAPCPEWLIRLVTASNGTRLRFDGTPLVLSAGQRNDLLYRLACALRRYGIGEAALLDCLAVIDRHHSRPPLGDIAEFRRISASAARHAPAERTHTVRVA